MTKYIIFDAGTLINLAQNGLLDIFKELSKIFQGEFLITPTIKYEAIDHPLKIKRFEWGALRIQQLLDENIIKLITDLDLVSLEELNKQTQNILDVTNNSFFSNNKSIHLIERGEAECLALSDILTKKGIQNAVSIEERTARMLCESPQNLEKLMEAKLHTQIDIKKSNFDVLRNIKVIRSTELMFFAHKNKLFDGDKRTMEAVLYALKFGGCSISEKEIGMMKVM